MGQVLLNRQYSTGLLTGKKIGEKKRIFWLNCMNLLKNIGRNGIIIIKINKKSTQEIVAKEYAHKYRYIYVIHSMPTGVREADFLKVQSSNE